MDVSCKCVGMLTDDVWEKRHESNRRVYDADHLAPTVTTCGGGGQESKVVEPESIRIRKLTPRECFRLMDFDDADYDAARAVNSESQLYKQAGNSIVVNCLVAILGEMIEGKETEYEQ